MLLRLEPRAAVIEVGQTLDLTVAGATGPTLPVLEVRDSALLGVIGPMRVVGQRDGETHVLARFGARIDSVAVAVVDPGACSLALRMHPSGITIRVGESLQFEVVECNKSTAEYEFSSSSAAVTITPDGFATGREVGSAVITARNRAHPTVAVTAVVKVE